MDRYHFQEPHLSDSLVVILRRRKVILLSILVTVLLVTLHALKMHPVYYAVSTIQLENERGTSVSFTQSAFPDYGWLDEKWFNTQVKILNSRLLAQGVVKRLGLRLQTQPEERVYEIFFKSWIPEELKFFGHHSGIKVKPLTVSANARNGTYNGTFLNEKNYILHDPEGKSLGQGEVDQPFMANDFTCIVSGEGSQGKCFEFEIVPESKAVKDVMDSLVVSLVKNSNLINVGAKWENVELARDIANAAVEEYKQTLISKRTREASQVLSFIETQLNETEKDLQAAEENLRKFKERGRIVSLDGQVRKSLEQITDYEKEFRTVQTYRRQAEILLSALKAPESFSDKKALYSLGMGLNSEQLKDLSKKLTDLTAQKSSMSTLLKEEHPKVQAIDREIMSVKNSIVDEVSAQISSLRVKEATYQSTLKKIEEDVQKLPALEKELFGLERIVKVGQGINLFLLQKRAELSINKASVLANVSVIDPAIRPGGWAEPDVPKRILWALLIGIALGLSFAFFVEYFDTTVKTPEQIQSIAQVPYLGTIYHSLTDSETPREELKMLEAPFSHIAEAFRTIKTNLLFYSTMGEHRKFILITSSGPSEGKTFVTANLAAAMAQSGKTVLMAETDLRNPSLHKIFGVRRSPGLSTALLDGSIDFNSLPIQRTFIENLKIIAAGEKPSNPSELLCSKKMEQFFSAVKDKFDYILFDSPPAYLTSDPLVLAQRVDGVVFVARSGEVKKDVFKETLANFLKLDSKVMGIVFNDMHRAEGKYYYYKYSYYYEEGEGGRERKKRRIRASRSKKLYPGYNYGEKDNKIKYLSK